MSKAFTREDEGTGFDVPAPSTRHSEGRLTAHGARILRERLSDLERVSGQGEGTAVAARLREILGTAEVVAPAAAEHVALGARVRVRSDSGAERTVVIATPDEVGIVPSAISAASPLARVLLGARVGETVELELPGGPEELTVLTIEWPE